MAVKKIQVWSDDGDEGLTPEEELQIEHKVDDMLSLDPVEPLPEAAVKTPKPAAKKVKKSVAINNDASGNEDIPGAPAMPTAPELAPATLPKTAIHVDIDEAELESIELTVETEPEIAPDPVTAPELIHEEILESPEPALEAPVEADEDKPKKYRPPDGPMQFKRQSTAIDAAEPDYPSLTPEHDAARAAAAVDDALTESLDHAQKRSKPLKPSKTTKLPRPRKAGLGRKTVAGIVAVFILIVVALGLIPQTRVKALNAFGIRGNLVMTIVDSQTDQPIGGAQVTVQNRTITTDDGGVASFSDISLGNQLVSVAKPAYTPQTVAVNLPWRSKAAATAKLPAAGPRYVITAKDSATGQPISDITANVNGTKFLSGSDGKISAVIDNSDNPTVQISASGYETSTIASSDLKSNNQLSLNVSADDIYIAQANAKYNVYARVIGQTSGRIILAGSGRETAQISVVPNALSDSVAVVSARDSQTDKAGYTLDALTIVTVADGQSDTVDHAATIKVVGWTGNRLLYTTLKADAAANDPQRYSLYSYDISHKKRTTLDQANNFNDVLLVDSTLYYAVSNKINGGTAAFMSIDSSGKSKRQILAGEVGTINRVEKNQLLLNASDGWYTYRTGDTKASKTAGSQTAQPGRLYIDNPYDRSQSAWIDTEGDDKGRINLQTGTKTQALGSIGNASYPLRWLSPQTLVYRVVSANGAASDYVIGLNGATPIKAADVTNAPGQKLWHD